MSDTLPSVEAIWILAGRFVRRFSSPARSDGDVFKKLGKLSFDLKVVSVILCRFSLTDPWTFREAKAEIILPRSGFW